MSQVACGILGRPWSILADQGGNEDAEERDGRLLLSVKRAEAAVEEEAFYWESRALNFESYSGWAGWGLVLY